MERFSRPPLERMMAIHQMLVEKQYPNAHTVARQFEVNPRTIKRDIEFMRDRLELPIEYDATRRGHYYSRPVKQFPAVLLNERELFALLVAQKVVSAYQGTKFAAPLQTALHRLASHLDDRNPVSLGHLNEALSIRPLGPEDTDVELFGVLSEALFQKRMVSFLYRRLGERAWMRRQVCPYHLAYIDHHWYLIGLDLQRKALRTFVLSRMKEVHLLKRTFSRPENFKADEYLKDSFLVFKGEDDYEVVIEFDAWATDLLRGRRWNPRHEWLELPGGGSRLRLRLNNIEEILGWVLSWGAHAMVVRPKRLASRVRAAAQAMLNRYPNTETEAD
ncbi:WYL domain-containing protein [Fontisphaera persica]|uniref:helix-turn-helix transcriptional regulator n=1 Tax=Fontisphaera persica TaxID=2974023 RepID=UPI0024C03FEC|nr:WYL domain-containing protein [Fontisphaera persica]WCJ59073.1 WYL domain-containing protein [Fontisphaera persica]